MGYPPLTLLFAHHAYGPRSSDTAVFTSSYLICSCIWAWVFRHSRMHLQLPYLLIMHMSPGLQTQQYSPPATLFAYHAYEPRSSESNIHLQLFNGVMRSLYQAGKSFDIHQIFEDHLRKTHAQTQATSHLQSDRYTRCKPNRQSSGFQQQCYG